MKCLKAWWNEECNRDLVVYHTFRRKEDWINYKETIRIAKNVFFNNKIQEIATTNKKPWNLINWIKKQKLPTTEVIKFNRLLCNNLDNL